METGDPNDGTNQFDPNEGADETTPLNPHRDGDEMEMSTRTSTSTSHHRNESFIDSTPSEKMRLEEQQDEAVERIKGVFPNANTSKFFTKIEDGKVIISLKRTNKREYLLLNKDNEVIIDENVFEFPPTLRNLLGKSRIEISRDYVAENERAEVEEKELDDKIANAVGEGKKRLVRKRERVREGIGERNREIEAIEERLPLKQRIKEIFKKYGFTVIAVSTAIATVIGVIVSNLKVGLTKVAQGVGNGLKELGKKTRSNSSRNGWGDC